MPIEISDWFSNKTFNENDYVTPHLDVWLPLLSPLQDKAVRILEIGSMEGRSALFFLNFLPHSTITCIDPLFRERSKIFDANLAEFSDRVTKIRNFSFPSLLRLREEGAAFDLMYIDGNHEREAVLLDSVLAWEMLRRDGLLIWDDYGFRGDRIARDQARDAVNGFLTAYADECEVVHQGVQAIVRKTKESPEETRSGRSLQREFIERAWR